MWAQLLSRLHWPEHDRDKTWSQGKPQHITMAHGLGSYLCHRHLMVQKTEHGPRECVGLTAVQTYQMTCDLINSLGDKLYKLSSSIQIAFIGRCGAVLCTLQSRASSFCGSLHGSENVNYLAQVSHYYVACWKMYWFLTGKAIPMNAQY